MRPQFRRLLVGTQPFSIETFSNSRRKYHVFIQEMGAVYLTIPRRLSKGFTAGLAFLLLAFSGVSNAENAAFDLSGPKIQIKVQRAGNTLPMAEVPNLQAGDRLWVHPDLP